jgi:hypothetical protein
MNRELRLITTLLAAAAVIAIAAGCAKSNETPVVTEAAPTADQRRTDAGPNGKWEADITGDRAQRIRVSLDLAKNAKSECLAINPVRAEVEFAFGANDA